METENQKVEKKEKKKMNRKLKKGLIIGGSSLGGVLLTILILFLVLPCFQGVVYQDFYTHTTDLFTIPGLNDSYVHQGLAYSKKDSIYLTSGYMSNNEPSRIYVIDSETYSSKKLNVVDSEGKAFTKHAGGISITGDYAYLSCSKTLYVFSITSLKEAKDNDSITYLTSFSTFVNASYTFADNEYMYVGEYYHDGDYKTDESHHLPYNNESFNALTLGYKIGDNEYGLENNIPDIAFSTRDMVQGFATNNDKYILSTSNGISSSHIYFYSNVVGAAPDSYFTYDNNDVPLYFLTSSRLVKDQKAPPMSEDIDIDGDNLLIGFESACQKWKLVNVFESSQIISYKIDF